MADGSRSVKKRRTCSYDCSPSLNSLTDKPAAVPHILSLPIEMLMYILQFLDHTEWVRLSCVNQFFRTAVSLLLRSVKAVDFGRIVQSSRGLKAESFVTYFLSHARNLRELTIHGSVLSSLRRPVVNEMIDLERLRKLDVSFCRIDATAFSRLLRGLPQLEELYMDGTLSYLRKDSQRGSQKYEPANSLVSKAFSSLTHLRVLHFSENDKVTGEVLLSLPKDHLEELTLNKWTALEPSVVDVILSQCRSLTKLNLCSPGRVIFSPSDFLSIKLVDSLPNPQLLKSFEFHDSSSGFTVSWSAFYKKCPQLEELSIDSSSALTSDCIDVLIENCTLLSKVKVHPKALYCSEIVRRIGRIPALKTLTIDCPEPMNGFDEVAFEMFCTVASKLEVLDFDHVRVQKECARSLGRLRNLTTLRIGWNTMENEVLQAIPPIVYANLLHLEIHDAPKITEGCLLLVSRHLKPSCRISFVNLCSTPLIQAMLNRFDRMLSS
ncbi:hypothetical protein M514_01120 [Trichuris suis]|uniref:F-box domain-containing protein n=1 Tax=Trichuris suis TaxID=68888 RepID=A0A085MZF7_9BILA|nr:hypothetical protein M513_01120 [Trichuris suis]KFD62603.1 hypothetical protein M514_01120 [Trichuris suis]KHJ45756.1 F-box domain protein [Trichuris suis]